MQMVAASKMRRVQERVVASRPYTLKLRSVLAGLVSQGAGRGENPHPLLARRPVARKLLVEVSPDRGLAGGLPSNINRKAAQFLLAHDVPVSVITVGKKGRDFMVRARRELKASFTDIGDRPVLADTLPITRLISNMYTSGEVDEVHLAFTRYINTLMQEPVVVQLLPIDTSELEDSGEPPVEYTFEPDIDSVLGTLLPRFLEIEVYQSILESAASEQSARMVAMRNATEAANDMIEVLTLELNKARQDMITAELLDIVGGVAALEG
jgi:F-type H+-transporting ATPase subunit gamma